MQTVKRLLGTYQSQFCPDWMEHLVFWFQYDIYTNDRWKEIQIVVVLKGIGEDKFEIILVPYFIIFDLWKQIIYLQQVKWTPL